MRNTPLDDAFNHGVSSLLVNGDVVNPGKWQAIELDPRLVMIELWNFQFQRLVPETLEALQEDIKPDLPWAEDHFQERVSGEPTNPGKTYKYWPYNTFKERDDPFKNEEGNIFSHTYQERYWPKEAGGIKGAFNNHGIRYQYGDLQDVIELLYNHPETRQAILPVWFPEDTGSVHGKRVPCSIFYHFYIRNNAIHINYYIRSCDAYRHYRNDIYLTARLLQYVAEQLRLMGSTYQIGYMIMTIGSLHIFKNDLYAFSKDTRLSGNIKDFINKIMKDK